MPLAVPYVRFSSDRQQHGSSVHRQEVLIVDWLAHNPGYTRFEQRFEDLGVSGSSGRHVAEGALGKLLAAIADGFIPAGSVVLVEAMDRFSRLEPMDTLNHLKSIVSAGIDLVTLGDGQRYDASCLKGTSLLYLAMKAQAAHEFSSRLADMVIGSYNKKAAIARGNQASEQKVPIKRRNPFWLTSEGELLDAPHKAIEQVFLAFSNGVPLRALAAQYAEYFANRQS